MTNEEDSVTEDLINSQRNIVQRNYLGLASYSSCSNLLSESSFNVLSNNKPLKVEFSSSQNFLKLQKNITKSTQKSESTNFSKNSNQNLSVTSTTIEQNI